MPAGVLPLEIASSTTPSIVSKAAEYRLANCTEVVVLPESGKTTII